jgi:hypothetical protein
MHRDIPVLLVVVAMQPMVPVCLLVREMLEQSEPQPVFLVAVAALAMLLELLWLELAGAQEEQARFL